MNTRMGARGRIAALVALGTTFGSTTGLAAAPAAGQFAPPNPLRVSARQAVLAGRTVPVHGALTTGQGGRTILVQVSRGHGWRTVTKARTGGQGRFSARWRPATARRYGLRVVLTGTSGAVRTVGGGVTAYHAAAASWYGPGLYGSHLACGGTLDSNVVGVANKTMPCGSRVRLRYGGRTVTARVVDRGPYVAGREFDLTAATKQKIGFGSTGTVWASQVQ